MNLLGINFKKLEKQYSPEQIRGFLSELADDQLLPEPARKTFKRLLDRYNKGQSLKSSVKAESKEMITVLKQAKKELKNNAESADNDLRDTDP